ncbi:hypothetical protein HAX54_008374, partial [Datura stramonium]|nr:hypothetical protein [Datura stramonium]
MAKVERWWNINLLCERKISCDWSDKVNITFVKEDTWIELYGRSPASLLLPRLFYGG